MRKNNGKTKQKELDYAREGRDEEFDTFRTVLVALTSGAVGLLFALLTTSPAISAIRMYRMEYIFALLSFGGALCLLLLSYWFGWLYFDAHYDALESKTNGSVLVKEAIYATLDNWFVYISGVLFAVGITFAGVFVYRFVFM